MYRRAITVLLVALIAFPIFQAIRTWGHVDVQTLATKYTNSQYCLTGYRIEHGTDALTPEYASYCGRGETFSGNIDDPDLYTFAGWNYIRGADPSSINFEVQPLVKYFFGLSELLFGTPLVLQWCMGVMLLALVYLLARMVLPEPLSLLPSAALAWDGLFREQVSASYVDLGETVLILLFLYLLIRAVRSRNFAPAMVVMGGVALAKSFSIGIVLASVSFVWLYGTHRQLVWSYYRAAWVAVATYLVGYIGFFIHHGNLLDFFRLHLNVIRLYKSYVPEYPKGEVFRILFADKWRQWYGAHALIPAPGWSLLWPVSLMLTFGAPFIRKLRAEPEILLHLTWIFVYLAFISLRLVFPRYVLPVLPSFYIVAVAVLANFSHFATVKLWYTKSPTTKTWSVPLQ